MHVKTESYTGTVRKVSVGVDGWFGADIDGDDGVKHYEFTAELPAIRPGQVVTVERVTTTHFEVKESTANDD